MTAGGHRGASFGEGLGAESDETLAGRVHGGDESALEELVRRYLRPVHAVAASFLPELADVEDAAQETFLRALGGIRRYDSRRPFAPWLYQIARNVARNHLAASTRIQTDVAASALPSALPGPEVVTERLETRALVEAAIARLPEQQRTAFRLADVEGYSMVDVARLMGLSAGTVRSHVHHARRALRAMLAELSERVENGRG